MGGDMKPFASEKGMEGPNWRVSSPTRASAARIERILGAASASGMKRPPLTSILPLGVEMSFQSLA